MAAVGSAVGLGNIWRFPYVAYENGGGAFILPYLVALLTAGLPFLFFDYAIGHRFRGSGPLSFRRLSRKSEFIGWWQVMVCIIIAIYYAAIIAWAAQYTIYSPGKSWGADPESYFFGDFLNATATPEFGFDFVGGLTVPLIIVWLVVLVILAFGVQRGIGATSVVFIPLLLVMFVVLVVQALTLPGAFDGLNALFQPNWSALGDVDVWLAAYSQIFFSLSIGFGIMITYASYVGRHTDMTGSGAVAGMANSSFEVLAGIGVFSALGFMAQAAGNGVDQVASDGIGLAFIGFPAIISQAPAGGLIGVLFFGSLVLAGLTSLVSIVEVVISALRDKLGMSRIKATGLIVVPIAVISTVLFGTTTGLPILDTLDYFVNRFGVLLVAIASIIAVVWLIRATPMLQSHLNRYGSIRLGLWWKALIGFITPVVLLVMLVIDFVTTVDEGYEGYPGWLIGIFGWGMVVGIVAVAAVLAMLPWSPKTSLEPPPPELDEPVESPVGARQETQQ